MAKEHLVASWDSEIYMRERNKKLRWIVLKFYFPFIIPFIGQVDLFKNY